MARIFNDMLLPLNEAGLLGGSKKKAYPEIRETIYRLREGHERLRHTQSVYSAPAASSEGRTIFFSTAEYSFDDYATFAGEIRDEGEYARCIDVPVNRPKRHSIINRFPANLPKEKRRRWAEDRVIELRKACEANHGTAFRRYIEYLIASRDTLEARIKKYMSEMDQFGQRPVVKGALEHARQNIGLLYAGGRLAIDAGLVPWKPEQLLHAVATCWRRALDLHGKKEDALTQAKRALRAGLKSEKVKKRMPSASFSSDEADGYYLMKDGVRIYTVHAAAMRKWLGTDPKQFDRLLDSRSDRPRPCTGRLSTLRLLIAKARRCGPGNRSGSERLHRRFAEAPAALMRPQLVVFADTTHLGLQLVKGTVHLFAERDAVKLIEHGLLEALADTVGLRALRLGARVIDVLDREPPRHPKIIGLNVKLQVKSVAQNRFRYTPGVNRRRILRIERIMHSRPARFLVRPSNPTHPRRKPARSPDEPVIPETLERQRESIAKAKAQGKYKGRAPTLNFDAKCNTQRFKPLDFPFPGAAFASSKRGCVSHASHLRSKPLDKSTVTH